MKKPGSISPNVLVGDSARADLDFARGTTVAYRLSRPGAGGSSRALTPALSRLRAREAAGAETEVGRSMGLS